MPNVNHEILVWARKTAHLTREQAVEKLGINAAKGVPALHRLAALERGEAAPTRPQLVKMARHYRRPLLTFYLSSPPRGENRGADFRSLTREYSVAEEALLDALLRDIRARQIMVRAALEDEDEAEHLRFIGSREISDGTAALLASLHALLGVDWVDYRRQPNPETAFSLLRTRAETAGVFVMLKGDLGSYHTAIDVEVFRGFALADDVAPFIVINDGDAKPAWSFTLLHELVHLLLGQTGISAARSESKIERFCNDVAGEFLLPARELKHLDLRQADLDVAAQRIAKFADERHLSHAMIAYAALRRGAIDGDAYDVLARRLRQQWLRTRTHRRTQTGELEQGPSYYVVRRHRLGNGLLAFARHMMNVGALTTSKAARILGVKPNNVRALLDIGGLSE